MRTLLEASMNTEATNQATKDGSIKRVFETFAEQYKPEAAYFTAENGKRTAYFFFDLKVYDANPRDCRAVLPTTGRGADSRAGDEQRRGHEGIGAVVEETLILGRSYFFKFPAPILRTSLPACM